MSPTAEPDVDWKTDITVNKRGWMLDVLEKCPDFTFPDDFLNTFTKRPDTRGFPPKPFTATPDGKSFEHWVNHIRYTEVSEDEYDVYGKRKTMKNLCTDEQLIRFQRDYWRAITYEHIQQSLAAKDFELFHLKEALQEVQEMLESRLEDEKENREEDREHNKEAERRRQSAAEEHSQDV